MTGVFRNLVKRWGATHGYIDEHLRVLTSHEEAIFEGMAVKVAVMMLGLHKQGDFQGHFNYGNGSTQGFIREALVHNHVGREHMKAWLMEQSAVKEVRDVDGVRSLLRQIAEKYESDLAL